LQAEILFARSRRSEREDWHGPADSRQVFIVGDPKQSIYRFRRADVALYEAVKRQVIASGGALVELNVSFRSVPQIQEAVNAAFSRVMGPGSDVGVTSSQARYVPLAPHRPAIDTQPAVVALPVPEPYPAADYRKPTFWKIEETEPDGIAAFVDWLVRQSGWTVTERRDATTRVPIQRVTYACCSVVSEALRPT
jgi:ATP-dependent exoDNAse (exonuclease V) beta subunit